MIVNDSNQYWRTYKSVCWKFDLFTANVYAVILSFCEMKKGICYLSHEELGKYIGGLGYKTVERKCKILKEYGLIRDVTPPNKKGHYKGFTRRYKIVPSKLDELEAEWIKFNHEAELLETSNSESTDCESVLYDDVNQVRTVSPQVRTVSPYSTDCESDKIELIRTKDKTIGDSFSEKKKEQETRDNKTESLDDKKKRIKARLQDGFHIIADNNKWDNFINFIIDREDKYHQPLNKFIRYALDNGFDAQFWTPENMKTKWPQAFISDEIQKKELDDFTPPIPVVKQKVEYAPMPANLLKRNKSIQNDVIIAENKPVEIKRVSSQIELQPLKDEAIGLMKLINTVADIAQFETQCEEIGIKHEVNDESSREDLLKLLIECRKFIGNISAI